MILVSFVSFLGILCVVLTLKHCIDRRSKDNVYSLNSEWQQKLFEASISIDSKRDEDVEDLCKKYNLCLERRSIHWVSDVAHFKFISTLSNAHCFQINNPKIRSFKCKTLTETSIIV